MSQDDSVSLSDPFRSSTHCCSLLAKTITGIHSRCSNSTRSVYFRGLNALSTPNSEFPAVTVFLVWRQDNGRPALSAPKFLFDVLFLERRVNCRLSVLSERPFPTEDLLSLSFSPSLSLSLPLFLSFRSESRAKWDAVRSASSLGVPRGNTVTSHILRGPIFRELGYA